MRSPPWRFNRMTVGPDGNVSTLDYHTWKQRIQDMIRNLNIPEAIALNVLQNDPNIIPTKYRNLLGYCQSLRQCFNRLEQVFPDLQTTLYQLKETLFRPPCADNSPAIVSRCDELLGGLELLVRIHPQNRLTRMEALAILSGIGGGEVTASITGILQAFDRWHNAGYGTYEQLLHNHLTCVRKTRLDLMCARQLVKREPPMSVHLLYNADRPRKHNLIGPPSSGGLTAAPTKKSCPLCQQSHVIWFCPELKQVQEGKRALPAPLCKFCLRHREGRLHPLRCFEFPKKDGKVGSVLCTGVGHRNVHYRICIHCKGKRNPIPTAG